MREDEIEYIQDVSPQAWHLAQHLSELLWLTKPRKSAVGANVEEARDINTVEVRFAQCFYDDQEEMNRLTKRRVARDVVRLFAHARDRLRKAPEVAEAVGPSHLYPAADSFDAEAGFCLKSVLSPDVLDLVGADVGDLLSQWKLPGSLEAAVTEVYLAACLSRALGRNVEFHEATLAGFGPIIRSDLSAIRFVFPLLPAEPLDHFVSRTKDFLKSVKQELLARTPGTSSGRKRTQLERNVSWLYRVHVKGEDLQSIAARHTEGSREWDEERWGDVRDGVNRVLTLLGDERARGRLKRRQRKSP